MTIKNTLAACVAAAAIAAIGVPTLAQAQATSRENNATSGSGSHATSMHKSRMKGHHSSSMKHRPASDKAKRAGA